MLQKRSTLSLSKCTAVAIEASICNGVLTFRAQIVFLEITVHRACSPTEVLYPEAPNACGWVVGQELRSLSGSSLSEAPGKLLLLLGVGRRLACGLVQPVYPMQLHLCCRVQPLAYFRLGRLIQIDLSTCKSSVHWEEKRQKKHLRYTQLANCILVLTEDLA